MPDNEFTAIDATLDAVIERWGMSSAALPEPFEQARFLAAFAALGWRLRRVVPLLRSDERARLRLAGVPAPECLSAAELARARMLRGALAHIPAASHAWWLQELFRTGDNAEREAILKVLMLLPEAERFLETALDACRAAVRTTVEAIACDNAYPALHMPASQFRALVLKAMHLGLPLERIHGLDGRMDDELLCMASDYASERRAAGRAVAEDVQFFLSRSRRVCA